MMTKSKMIKFMIPGLVLVMSMTARPQSGGDFNITQSVIASGGGQITGGTFSLDGTIGQASAGDAQTGPPFAVTSGFWNFTPTGPTASSVSVSGQVRIAGGRGIRNAVITLTTPNGSRQIALSSSFGYYQFSNITAGETYIVSIAAKRFTFAQSTIIIGVFDEITGLDFVADPLP